MIIKQPDKIVSDDKFSKAGYEAEKQMAFYLHRAFADEKHIAVLNGIRLQKDNDVCQIDHLIVHEYGMVIVESKSVTSKVKINEDGYDAAVVLRLLLFASENASYFSRFYSKRHQM